MFLGVVAAAVSRRQNQKKKKYCFLVRKQNKRADWAYEIATKHR